MSHQETASTSSSESNLVERIKTSEAHTRELEKNGISDPEKGSQISEPVAASAALSADVKGYSGWQWVMVCIALYSAALLYGLDNTIVASVQAATVERFGKVEKLGWVGIGFPLGSIATLAPFGKAYGLFDIKWLYIASLTMFAAGTALCGGAPNMNALIVGRVWAGAGGSGMYLGVLSLLTINTTIQQRPIYMGLTGLIWGLGSILGPLIGGAFSDSSATWRWAFYLLVCLLAVFSPVYVFMLHSVQPRPDISFTNKLLHLDWVGILLNAGMYVSFVMVFTFGGAQWAWDDGRTIALFVVFGIITITFAVQQTFAIFTTVENRLFPVDFLRRRSLVLLYISTAAGSTCLFITVYYIPLYFAFSRGETGVMSAVRLLPFICITIFVCLVNGGLMPKFGYYMPWYLVSAVFALIGGSLMYSLVDARTSNSAIYGYSVLVGIGAGLSQQAAYSIVPAKVQPHRVPDALSFVNTAQIGGIVIGLTITSTIFQNIGYKHLHSALASYGFAPADLHAALAGAKSTIFVSAPPDAKKAAVDAIVMAISDGYILIITAGAVGIICALLMKREKLFMEAAAGA